MAKTSKQVTETPVQVHLPVREKDSELLTSIIETAKENEASESKVLKLAVNLAARVKTKSTNDISESELLDYAKGVQPKGWLTEFLIANSPTLRGLKEKAKDKGDLTGAANAKSLINHAQIVANQVLMAAFYVFTLKDGEYKLTAKGGKLLTQDADGDPLVMSTQKVIRAAREKSGRTNQHTAKGQQAEKVDTLTSALSFVTSALAKAKTMNDFSPEIRDDLNLIYDQIVGLIGKETAIELLKAA